MSRTLANLLGMSEHATASATAKLEELSGYHGEDNRLVSEIKMALRHRVAQLGLDPDDTTPNELYHGLLARFHSDSHHLKNLLGAGSVNSSDKLAKRLSQLVDITDIPQDVWVLRRSSAKNLLRKQAPKKLMRQFNCRSIDSLIKRNDIDQLYAALPFVESANWLKNLYHQHTTLKPSDFEIRPLRIVSMPSDQWPPGKFKAEVTSVPQMGVVVLWPSAIVGLGHGVKAFVELIDAINDLRVYSLAIASYQMSPSFGRSLSMQLEDGFSEPVKIGHLPVSWHSLQLHYGRLANVANPLAGLGLEEGRHHNVNAAKVLANLHPTFRWWPGSEILAADTLGIPISLNISDVVHNLKQKHRYGHHSSKYLHSSLQNELVSRYLQHPGVERYIMSQLGKLTNPQKLTLAPEPNFQKDLQLV